MPKTIITFGGTSSDDMGVVIERRPENVHALRSYQSYTVPGRNGILTIDNGTYGTYIQEYECYIKDAGGVSVQQKASAVSEWINGQGGFSRLDDTLEPDWYRMAVMDEAITAENIYNKFGRFTLSFLCQPERWLTSGETLVELSAPGTITNPTVFDAKPLIIVHGTNNGTGTLSCGGNVLTINSITDEMILDCDLMDAYDSDSTNLNADVSGAFPIIPSGAQTFGITGAITKVEIKPRWWTI